MEPEQAPDEEVVDRAADEGVLIARAASVVAVANRIIVRALRADEPFDLARTRMIAQHELYRIAEEQMLDAERMEEARDVALRTAGKGTHQFDYRQGDAEPLALRAAIYSRVAERLIRLSADDAYVGAVVDSARERAWNDVGSAVISRLGEAVAPDADYERERAKRMRLLAADVLGIVPPVRD
jgi:hypothetical protein